MAEKPSINAKFVRAYAAMANPPLDSVNPHFRNKFASLKATLKVIRDACKPQGIAYIQTIHCGEPTNTITSFVLDEDSGDMITLSTFPLVFPADPQKRGSELTYAKRQLAQADWGLVGDPDDDAEAASKPEPPKKAQPPQRDYQPLKAECERLAAIHSTTLEDEWRFVVETYGNPKGMDDEEYQKLVTVLQNMERN